MTIDRLTVDNCPMPFMFRSAEDDFAALRTADAMESAGATVVAITPNGQATYEGALAPHVRYTVWARIRDDDHIRQVDKAIEVELG